MDAINFQMRLFAGDGNSNEPALHVAPNDITLQDNKMIPIKVLDLVSHHLRFDAMEKGFYGFLPPSILFQFAIENKELPYENRVPEEKNGMNMHYLKSQHYIMSYKIIQDGVKTITIHDSIPIGERIWL